MSLRVDERGSRGRSKSPGGRERERSRSNVRASEAQDTSRAPPYGYPTTSSALPGGYGSGVTSPSYEVRTPPGNGHGAYFPPTSHATHNPYAPAVAPMPGYPPEEGGGGGFTMGGYTDLPPHERPGYVPPQGHHPPPPQHRGRDRDDDLAYDSDSSGKDSRSRGRPSRNSSYNAQYRYTPQEYRPSNSQYQYAQAPDQIKYTAKPTAAEPQRTASYTSTPYGQPPAQQLTYTSAPASQFHEQLPRTYSHNAYEQDAHVVDITPGRERLDRTNSSSHTARLSTIGTGPSSLAPGGLSASMNRLSVSGNRPDLSGGGAGMAPPSPLLEAYHGTYQSISPMPLAIRPVDDDDLSDLEPLSPAISRSSQGGHGQGAHSRAHKSAVPDRLARDVAERERKEKKRVKLYDPEEDAKMVASALNHHKPDADALCDVLPRLSHDQMMEMRREYKKQVKVQGRGVNLSKHINMKLSGNFGKAVYVTALGRWEGEGYWANFFYQSHGSRRELLIESLMGRTNAEIRMIKDEFKDKRYSDSLTRCMEKELKMDKFRTAVLMVLEERRQEEQDVYPTEYVHRDVDTLYRSVRAEKGGESAMLDIIVRRSDAHLREVLRAYDKTFGENFARAALAKSNNLVGEVIAHILNGVINKPARDSLLLQHAIHDIASKNHSDELRYELLISRLVRIHWDRMHLARVKKYYWEKYRTTLEDAIEAATKGDFLEFMCELCETK